MRTGLLELNVFKDSSRNTETTREQRLATRLFLIILGISLVSVGSYAFLSTQTDTITINNPSMNDFAHLSQLHPDSLRCPCSQIAVKYSDVIEIKPVFHQVCSSVIVSSDWYGRLTSVNITGYRRSVIFDEALGTKYFQGLSTFCALAESTAINAYRLFSANNLINNRALSRILFDGQVNALIDSFIATTHTEFIGIFSLVRQTIRTSQFATQAFTNFALNPNEDGRLIATDRRMLVPRKTERGSVLFSCSCQNQDSVCGGNVKVFDPSAPGDFTYIPNMFVRCIPTESVLTSTLECWYDPHCYGLVAAAYTGKGVSNLSQTVPLNSNISSRFSPNTTFGALMEELMLEQWAINTSYEKFFHKCAPLSCSYTVENRFSWLFVIVTILSMYGGLNQGLRLGLPTLVRLGLLVVRRIRMKLHPVNQPVSLEGNVQSSGKSYSLRSLSNDDSPLVDALRKLIEIFDCRSNDQSVEQSPTVSVGLQSLLVLGKHALNHATRNSENSSLSYVRDQFLYSASLLHWIDPTNSKCHCFPTFSIHLRTSSWSLLGLTSVSVYQGIDTEQRFYSPSGSHHSSYMLWRFYHRSMADLLQYLWRLHRILASAKRFPKMGHPVLRVSPVSLPTGKSDHRGCHRAVSVELIHLGGGHASRTIPRPDQWSARTTAKVDRNSSCSSVERLPCERTR